MKTIIGPAILVSLAVLLSVSPVGAQGVLNAVHGTVDKIDSGTKTIVVKTADGTEHTIKVADQTTVHGVHGAMDAGKDSWHGLTEGTEVVAHYTTRGTEDTAVEIDDVGKDGLKASKGTITEIDRGGKKIVVAGDDGVKSTYDITDHAAKDGLKDVAVGTEKGAKVTVYYTERAGKKVVHFFEKE